MMGKYPMGKFVGGVLRCPTCNSVLRPLHRKRNCCKSAYRQRMAYYKAQAKEQNKTA